MSNFFDDESDGSHKETKVSSFGDTVRKVLMVVVPLIIFLVASYLFYQFLTDRRESIMTERTVIEQVTTDKIRMQLALEDIVANLTPVQKKNSIIKLSLVLEIEGSSNQELELVEGRSTEINDIFQIFLRDLRVTDLNGSEGTIRLKEELVKRANKVLAPVKVTDVLFREILVN